MRLNFKAFFLILAGWAVLSGLFLGTLVFVAQQAGRTPVSTLELMPFSFAVASAVCAVGLWALQKLAILRLQELRNLMVGPEGRPFQSPAQGQVKGDPFSILAKDLKQLLEGWRDVHGRLLTTHEEDLREAKVRSAELARQNADVTAELSETRESRAVSEGVEALFVKIFESSPLGMAVMTTREGYFSEVNPKFLDLLGYQRDEVMNHSDEELALWAKPHAREHFVRKLSGEKSLHGAECQLRTKTGELRKVALSLTPATVHETPCVVLTVQDPDERMRVELELLQNQKMEAVGQLAAGMAHDFNNILMIVQGYTNVLMTDPTLDNRSGEALRQVSGAADRAAHLTRQLLAFGRKQMMQPRTLEVQELVKGMASTLQQLLGLEVRFGMDFAADTPPVEADPGMLQEVVMNLAMNARDAVGEGGEFRISTSAVKIERVDQRTRPEARLGEFACLTVKDNGSGIDQAVLGRIFEPFFTTKEVGKGTGLGLATVYGIVKQHNGWVEVESQLDVGSTFRIYLPATPRTTTKPAPGNEAELTGAETILVVEDEPGLRALVSGILKRYGYNVLIASNGAGALRLWKEHEKRVDLLLTDMAMAEGMSGHALAQKLRVDKPDLKVVYTSGYSVDVLSDSTAEFVEGVNFLQKPYRPQRLAETVRACLAGKGEALLEGAKS